MKELDTALDALTKLKPFVDEYDDLQAKIKSGQTELTSLTVQLDRLRTAMKAERDTRVQEMHQAKKEHEDLVMKRQGAVADVEAAAEIARAELVQVQNDIAKFHRKLDELAKQYNKEVKALA